MGITKLIADMDLDIVDLSDDESTDKTGVKLKDGTIAINSGNDTETNSEDRDVKILNENEAGINWDFLEMESDKEEVETQKESQASGNSVLLLEAESNSLVLSNREDHFDMNKNDNLGSEMRGKGDQLKGLSQNNVVCSSESRVGSENMTVKLTLVSEDIDIENEKREGLNYNIDLDRNANENLHLGLGMGGENLKGLSENSSISISENKEKFAENKVGLVLGGTDDKKMENENMLALDQNVDLDVDKNHGVGLYLGKPRDFDVVIECSANTTMEKRDKSEKLELQFISKSGDKESRIDYMDGLNQYSDSGACANNRLRLGPGGVDDNLKDLNGSSVASCFERKGSSEKMNQETILFEKDKEMDNESVEGPNANEDFVLKEGINSEALIKGGETGSAENKDKGEEVDHEKLNLEGVIANSTAVRGDKEMNDFELVMGIGVQDTIVDASKRIERNKDQMEITEPSLDDANTDFGSKFELSNNVGPTTSNNELETMYRGSPSSSILDSKPPKRRGRPRKAKGKVSDPNTNLTLVRVSPSSSILDSKSPKRRGRPEKAKGAVNDPNTNLTLVIYNSGGNSNSQGKRDRKESKYLSHPYTNIDSSPKRPKIDQITKEENRKAKEGKKMKTGKTDKYSQKVVVNLISTAQGPLNPQQTNLTMAARGFLTSFRDSVCSKVNVKTSQEVCPMTSGPTVNVPNSKNSEVHRDHHLLLDARNKLDGIISSLNGSDLENKEILVGDASGLLDKIDLILTKDFKRILGSNIGNKVLQQQFINLE